MYAAIAVSTGAALGALLRWGLGARFNDLSSAVPLGTLAANLLGGYLIGVAAVVLDAHTSLAPEWRLFVVTGFLGGLTTFSTFSAEVVSLLERGAAGWAAVTVFVHVAGSLALTFAGLATALWLHRA